MWGCRGLSSNSFTGPLPTELGTMDVLTGLCVPRPHPLRRRRAVGCGSSQIQGTMDSVMVERRAVGIVRLASAVMFEAQQRTCTRCA
jgi:hypothetical protein